MNTSVKEIFGFQKLKTSISEVLFSKETTLRVINSIILIA